MQPWKRLLLEILIAFRPDSIVRTLRNGASLATDVPYLRLCGKSIINDDNARVIDDRHHSKCNLLQPTDKPFKPSPAIPAKWLPERAKKNPSHCKHLTHFPVAIVEACSTS